MLHTLQNKHEMKSNLYRRETLDRYHLRQDCDCGDEINFSRGYKEKETKQRRRERRTGTSRNQGHNKAGAVLSRAFLRQLDNLQRVIPTEENKTNHEQLRTS